MHLNATDWANGIGANIMIFEKVHNCSWWKSNMFNSCTPPPPQKGAGRNPEWAPCLAMPSSCLQNCILYGVYGTRKLVEGSQCDAFSWPRKFPMFEHVMVIVFALSDRRVCLKFNSAAPLVLYMIQTSQNQYEVAKRPDSTRVVAMWSDSTWKTTTKTDIKP